MSLTAVHRMDTELITDRQTMRYTCRRCQRCVEDGPEGIAVVHKGDTSVGHRGGELDIWAEEIDQDPSSGPVLH